MPAAPPELALAELGGATAMLLHALGLALLGARVLHAYGVSQTDENYRFRISGMALTCAAIIGGAVLCLSVSWPVPL